MGTRDETTSKAGDGTSRGGREAEPVTGGTDAGRPDRTPEGAGEGDAPPHRAGFCAVAGLPNVGKSTLVNRLTGAELSIVTPKAQTTRRRLRALYSDERHQVVFEDTPGLLEPRYPLQEAMREEASRALRGADVRLWVVDAGFDRSVEATLEVEDPDPGADVVCLNKVDRVGRDRRDELVEAFRDAGWRAVVPAVATKGEGVDRVRSEVLRRLPASPPLYPRDQLAVAPVRRFVAEFVREACFRELEEEVPYSVAVSVREFRESEDPLYIAADVYVERPSQKGIVIGENGRMIRRIGTAARGRVEDLVGRQVYLDLRVAVRSKWRKKTSELARLGFEVRDQKGG